MSGCRLNSILNSNNFTFEANINLIRKTFSVSWEDVDNRNLILKRTFYVKFCRFSRLHNDNNSRLIFKLNACI